MNHVVKEIDMNIPEKKKERGEGKLEEGKEEEGKEEKEEKRQGLSGD